MTADGDVTVQDPFRGPPTHGADMDTEHLRHFVRQKVFLRGFGKILGENQLPLLRGRPLFVGRYDEPLIAERKGGDNGS